MDSLRKFYSTNDPLGLSASLFVEEKASSDTAYDDNSLDSSLLNNSNPVDSFEEEDNSPYPVVDSSIWVDSPIKEAGAGSAKEDTGKDGVLENKEQDEADQSDQKKSLKLGWIKKYAWKAVASGSQGIIERNLLLEKAKAGSYDAVAIRNESYDNRPEPVNGMSEFSSNIGHSSDEQDYPTDPYQRDVF